MIDPASLERAIARVRGGISAACRRSGRDPAEVTLVAVTKTVRVEGVIAARRAGLEHFGENYARELGRKAAAVPATWHFLGTLQGGTAAQVAAQADVVHSAEPGHGMDLLARRAAATGRIIPCLVEVDLAGRGHGVSPLGVEAFVARTANLPGVRLIGLMTIPAMAGSAEEARPSFARLRQLGEGLRNSHPELRELSMGMSADYAVAIEEGATIVRIGTALFGPRPVAGAPGPPGQAS